MRDGDLVDVLRATADIKVFEARFANHKNFDLGALEQGHHRAAEGWLAKHDHAADALADLGALLENQAVGKHGVAAVSSAG